MMKYNIIKEISLTDEEIDDIITTAVEGGIGYWACLLNEGATWDKTVAELNSKKSAGEIQDVFWCTIIRTILGSGGTVKFQDAEDTEDGDIWEMTSDKFINGCKLYETNRGDLKKTLEDGNFDAVEADCLFQYALFGEIIYG